MGVGNYVGLGTLVVDAAVMPVWANYRRAWINGPCRWLLQQRATTMQWDFCGCWELYGPGNSGGGISDCVGAATQWRILL